MTKKKMNKQLIEATTEGNLEKVKIALKEGAAINTKSDFFKQTALHIAASIGYIDIIKFLLEEGADAQIKDDSDMIPLHLAVLYKHTNIVKLLLAKSGKLSAKILDDVYSVASMMSIDDCSEIVELISEAQRLTFIRESSPNISETDKPYAKLIKNASIGNIDGVKSALKEGADINALDDDTGSALLWAAMKGHKDIVSLLVENGVDVNLQNEYKWTALMTACGNGYLEIVKILLENGADVNVKNSVNSTALIFASRFGQPEIVRALLEKGADIYIALSGTYSDENGKTALAFAYDKGFIEIQKLIEEMM